VPVNENDTKRVCRKHGRGAGLADVVRSSALGADGATAPSNRINLAIMTKTEGQGL